MSIVREDDFEGGPQLSWATPFVSGGSSISFTADPADVGPSGVFGTGCMRLTSLGTDCHTEDVLPAARDVSFVRTYFNLASHDFDDGDDGFIGYVTSPDDDELFSFRLRQEIGGAVSFVPWVSDNGTLNQKSGSTIVAGTWYRLEYMWNKTASTWEVRLDGATLASGTLTGSAAAWQMLKIHMGGFDGDFDSSQDTYVDLYAIDDADWVGEAEGGEPPAVETFILRRRR